MSEYKVKKLKSYRLSDSSIELIANVSKEKNISESETIRMLLDKGAYEYKLEVAIEAYLKEDLDLTNASKIAGLSKRDFISELNRKGIGVNLDKNTFEYGLMSLNKILKK